MTRRTRRGLAAVLGAAAFMICFALAYEAGYAEGADRALRDNAAAQN